MGQRNYGFAIITFVSLLLDIAVIVKHSHYY